MKPYPTMSRKGNALQWLNLVEIPVDIAENKDGLLFINFLWPNRDDAYRFVPAPNNPKILLPNSCSKYHHHFPIGLIRLHRLLRFANLLKFKNACWLGFVNSGGCFIHNALKWNIRDWKIRRSKNKTPEECEINATWHLEKRIKIIY